MNVTDWADELRAIVGTAMTVGIPLIDELGIVVQVVGGLGGLYMLFLSIKHKRLQIKNEQNKRPI